MLGEDWEVCQQREACRPRKRLVMPGRRSWEAEAVVPKPCEEENVHVNSSSDFGKGYIEEEDDDRLSSGGPGDSQDDFSARIGERPRTAEELLRELAAEQGVNSSACFLRLTSTGGTDSTVCL